MSHNVYISSVKFRHFHVETIEPINQMVGLILNVTRIKSFGVTSDFSSEYYEDEFVQMDKYEG